MTYRAAAGSLCLVLCTLGACLLAGCGQKATDADPAFDAQGKKAFSTATDPATLTDEQINKVPPQWRDMVRARRDAALKGHAAPPAHSPAAH